MNRKKTELRSTRPMYTWEIQEARRVFGEQLRYERVRIHEGATWPDRVNRIGTRMKDMKSSGDPNAITLGNHIYFPVRLLAAPLPYTHSEFYKIPWLIHELTHAWQYQRLGWRYLVKALKAQISEGRMAYDFGGEEWLRICYRRGWKLTDFNLEQQGDIARTYYDRLCRGIDISAWLPFVTEFNQRFD
jgi:hypothetical protein